MEARVFLDMGKILVSIDAITWTD